MHFNQTTSLHSQLEKIKDKTARLAVLLERAEILEEAVNQDGYKTASVYLSGMHKNLICSNKFELPLVDSIDLLETLSQKTDAEITLLAAELRLELLNP